MNESSFSHPDSDPVASNSFDSGAAYVAAGSVERKFPLSFTGDAKEFFRIWIVNALLTVVTLGFYTPWARVRTRRYFHAHTHLDGHSFDYLAKPMHLLWGYLIVLAFVGAYYAVGYFNPFFALGFLGLYAALAPWLIYKAMRFKARNTSYRNVRFEFRGSLGDSYGTFLGYGLLTLLTFGILTPYWVMKQKEYFYKNLYFGGKRFSFTPQAGEYFTRYILGGVMVFGASLLVGAVAAGLMAALSGGGVGDPESPLFMVALGIAYIPFLLVFSFVQVYIFVSLFNYNLGQLLLDRTRFESGVKLGRYYWITLSNVVLGVLTLGLMVPWGLIRKTRYVMENLVVGHVGDSLGEYVSAAAVEESALGDAAADAFEFDIGW